MLGISKSPKLTYTLIMTEQAILSLCETYDYKDLRKDMLVGLLGIKEFFKTNFSSHVLTVDIHVSGFASTYVIKLSTIRVNLLYDMLDSIPIHLQSYLFA